MQETREAQAALDPVALLLELDARLRRVEEVLFPPDNFNTTVTIEAHSGAIVRLKETKPLAAMEALVRLSPDAEPQELPLLIPGGGRVWATMQRKIGKEDVVEAVNVYNTGNFPVQVNVSGRYG